MLKLGDSIQIDEELLDYLKDYKHNVVEEEPDAPDAVLVVDAPKEPKEQEVVESVEEPSPSVSDPVESEPEEFEEPVSLKTRRYVPSKDTTYSKKITPKKTPVKKTIPKKTPRKKIPIIPKIYHDNMDLLKHVELFIEKNELDEIVNYDDADALFESTQLSFDSDEFDELKKLHDVFSCVADDIASIDEGIKKKSDIRRPATKIKILKKMFSFYDK